jgi:hypothetical protein
MMIALTPAEADIQQRARRFVDEVLRPLEASWRPDDYDVDQDLLMGLERAFRESRLRGVAVPVQCVTPSRFGDGSSVASTTATSSVTAACRRGGPAARRSLRQRTASSRITVGFDAPKKLLSGSSDLSGQTIRKPLR